ncbi:hypothetical protein NUH86_15525 [Sphingobium sp. JS3065]|uniref:hypothetical protein n=1 Tax=Sphingobium sp. JS3065 TaxID=2970925 RepID=UPI0022653B5D|nr:hypothetical protein [Sphingobium sp. JS3065]UZW54869.1 hypothetical protein NUH86_15525 [Sphingobium sp. JS3065]
MRERSCACSAMISSISATDNDGPIDHSDPKRFNIGRGDDRQELEKKAVCVFLNE